MIKTSSVTSTLPTLYRTVNVQDVHILQMADGDTTDTLQCRWATLQLIRTITMNALWCVLQVCLRLHKLERLYTCVYNHRSQLLRRCSTDRTFLHISIDSTNELCSSSVSYL